MASLSNEITLNDEKDFPEYLFQKHSLPLIDGSKTLPKPQFFEETKGLQPKDLQTEHVTNSFEFEEDTFILQNQFLRNVTTIDFSLYKFV